jgi:hypothetical protein
MRGGVAQRLCPTCPEKNVIGCRGRGPAVRHTCGRDPAKVSVYSTVVRRRVCIADSAVSRRWIWLCNWSGKEPSGAITPQVT